MITANSSPIADVLGFILEAQRGPTGLRWRVLSYRRDFDLLWGVGKHSKKDFISEIGAKESLILIWDGLQAHATEPTPVNVESPVTAYDWLTFLIIGLAQAPRRLRIVVV